MHVHEQDMPGIKPGTLGWHTSALTNELQEVRFGGEELGGHITLFIFYNLHLCRGGVEVGATGSQANGMPARRGAGRHPGLRPSFLWALWACFLLSPPALS